MNLESSALTSDCGRHIVSDSILSSIFCILLLPFRCVFYFLTLLLEHSSLIRDSAVMIEIC